MRAINTSKLSVKSHTKDFSSHDILLHPSLLPPPVVASLSPHQTLSQSSSSAGLQGQNQQGQTPQQGEKHNEQGESIPIIEIKQNSTVVYFRLKQTEAVKGVQHISILNECFLQTGLQQMKPCQMSYVRMERASLDHVRISFKDQFLSRSDMWPFTRFLLNESLYIGKRVEFRGMRGVVKQLMKNQKHVRSGVVSATTRISFRTQSGVTYLLVEMSKEMWEYASDGDVFWEKMINGFCRDLFDKWNANRASHSLQIVFYGRYRVHAPNRRGEEIVQTMEGIVGPSCCFTLYHNTLCVDFLRYIDGSLTSYANEHSLITQIKKTFLEYHNAIQDVANQASQKLGSRIDLSLVQSADSNFLEAMNLVLAAYQSHHVNRDLHHTGQYFIVLSAGVGVYNIHNSSLSSLSKKRIGDNGIGVDMVCFSYPPLHHIPLFKFVHKKVEGEFVYKSPDWLAVYFYDQKSYKDDIEKDRSSKNSTEHGDPIKNLQASQSNANLDGNMEEGIVLSTAPEYFQLPSDDKFIPTSRMPSLRDRVRGHRNKLPLPKFKKALSVSQISNVSFDDHDDRIFDVSQRVNPFSSPLGIHERDSLKGQRGYSASYGKKTRSYFSEKQYERNFEKNYERLEKVNEKRRLNPSVEISSSRYSEEEPLHILSSSYDSKRINISPLNSRIRSLTSHGSLNDGYSTSSPVKRFAIRTFNPFQNTIQNPMTLHLEAPKRPSLHQKRWAHLFPTDHARQNKGSDATALLPNWLSLVEPACLPVTTFYWPDSTTLSEYKQSNSQFSVDKHYNTMSLMQELICQRLHQGYQIYHPNNDPLNPSRHYYLSLSDQFQEIFIDNYNPDVVIVKRYVKKSRALGDKSGTPPAKNSEIGDDNDNMSLFSFDGESECDESIIYRFLMWNRLESKFLPRDIEFKNNPPDEYKWNQLDNIVLGYIDDLPLKLAPRCIQFHLVPSTGESQLSPTTPVSRVSSPTQTKSSSTQQLSLFLPTLTSRVFVPCAGENSLNVQFFDPENQSATFSQKRKMTTTRIKLENNGERYEWIFLTAKNTYYPGESYYFQIDWLVCSAVTIESYVQALQRKAKLCGYDMYTTPVDCNWPSYATPFRSYVKIPMPKRDENRIKVLQQLCTQHSFYSDLLPISIHSKRFIHKNGIAVVHIDTQFLWWLENLFSPNYNSENASLLRKDFEDFKLFCNGVITEENATQAVSTFDLPLDNISSSYTVSEEEKFKAIQDFKNLENHEGFMLWLKRFTTQSENWTRGIRQLKEQGGFCNPSGRVYKKMLQSFEKLLESIQMLQNDFGIQSDSFMQCGFNIQDDSPWADVIRFVVFVIIDARKYEMRRNRSKTLVESIFALRKEKDIKRKTAKRKRYELKSSSVATNEEEKKRITDDLSKIFRTLKQIQIEIEHKLYEIQSLNQYDILGDGLRVSLGLLDTSQDPIRELKRQLIETNLWIEREVAGYPKSGKILESITRTFSLSGEPTLLVTIPLKDLEIAMDTLNRYIYTQGRFFSLRLNGVFIEGENLFLEMLYFEDENILMWSKANIGKCTVEDLRKMYTKKDESTVIRAFMMVVNAVAELHSMGIEHNCLRPEIILVNASQTISLIDLGCKSGDTTTPSVYTPPHDGANHAPFGSADVYALGVIMFELFCPPEVVTKLNSKATVHYSKIIPSTFSQNWIRNVMIRMLDSDPENRPSVHEICGLFRQRVITQHPIMSDLTIQNLVSLSSSVSQIASSMRFETLSYVSNPTVKSVSPNLFESMTSLFSQITKKSDIFFHLQNGETGEMDTQCICDAYCAESFSTIGKLFDLEDGLFIPMDNQDKEAEMIAFGRFLYYCTSKGIRLPLKLHPLVYCGLIGKMPEKDSEFAALLYNCGQTFHNPDLSIITTISINVSLQSIRKSSQFATTLQELRETIQREKHLLLGSKYRVQNLKHLQKGFIEFMDDSQQAILSQLTWMEAEILCSGPKTISTETLFNFLSRSFADKAWEESEEVSQIRTWFKEWIQVQNNENLQLFLRVLCGSNYIPNNTLNFHLEAIPYNQKPQIESSRIEVTRDIASSTQDFLVVRSSSFNRLYIGTHNINSRNRVFQLLNSFLKSTTEI